MEHSNLPWPTGYRIKILKVDYILQRVILKGPVDYNGDDIQIKSLLSGQCPFHNESQRIYI